MTFGPSLVRCTSVALLLLVACRWHFDPLQSDGGPGSTGGPGRLTIHVVGRGVVITPDAICSTTCELDLPGPIAITAHAAEAWQFDGFSAPCGEAATCTPSLDATITATFSRAPIAANLAFVTATVPTLGAGGLNDLDAFCQTAASAAGLGGTYIAFVATSTATIAQRLAPARGWVRMDGLPILDQPTDLGAALPRAVLFDPSGVAVPAASVMTAVSFSGATSSGTCTDWTAAGTVTGAVSDHGGVFMYTLNNTTCAERVYCFGVDSSVPVTLVPPPYPFGRYIFVTSSSFTPGGGIAAADAQCQAEAAAAGLAGDYRALLASTTESIETHLGSLAGVWRRPDGIVVTHEGLDRLPLDAALNVTASGAATNQRVVWLGASSLTAADGSNTCADWTSTTGPTVVARPENTMLVGPQSNITCGAGGRGVLCGQL